MYNCKNSHRENKRKEQKYTRKNMKKKLTINTLIAAF